MHVPSHTYTYTYACVVRLRIIHPAIGGPTSGRAVRFSDEFYFRHRRVVVVGSVRRRAGASARPHVPPMRPRSIGRFPAAAAAAVKKRAYIIAEKKVNSPAARAHPTNARRERVVFVGFRRTPQTTW